MEYIIKVTNFDEKSHNLNRMSEIFRSKDTNCSDDEDDSEKEQMKSSLNTVSGSVDQVNTLDLVNSNEFRDADKNIQRGCQSFGDEKIPDASKKKKANEDELTRNKADRDLKAIQLKLNSYKKLCGQGVKLELKTLNDQFFLNHVRFSQENELNLDFYFNKDDSSKILNTNFLLTETLNVKADRY
jgi:hypothetical protein